MNDSFLDKIAAAVYDLPDNAGLFLNVVFELVLSYILL